MYLSTSIIYVLVYFNYIRTCLLQLYTYLSTSIIYVLVYFNNMYLSTSITFGTNIRLSTSVMKTISKPPNTAASVLRNLPRAGTQITMAVMMTVVK